MSSETQKRNTGGYVEDLWFKKDGTKKARHGKGKRWLATVVDVAGERSSESFDRKSDAQAWRSDQLSKINTGTFVAPSAGIITVGDMQKQWLKQQGHTAEATVARRESAWSAWAEPKWAKVAVRDVRKSDVRSWVGDMVSEGAGAATVENALEILRLVLAVAVEDRRLAANPCLGVKTPPRDHRPRAYLSHAQVWRLADSIGARSRSLVLLLAYTGLRFGEAAALEVRDVDLLRRRVEVRQQVTEVKGKLVWTPTKGKRRRSVPIPKFLVEPLSVACQGKRREDAIFTAAMGGTLRLNTWRRRVFNPVIDTLRELDDEGVAQSDFPDATPHDLRHTAASLAISENANVKAVQTMLGHQSAAMTLDTYADLFPADLDSVAAAFDKAVAQLGEVDPEAEETAG